MCVCERERERERERENILGYGMFLQLKFFGLSPNISIESGQNLVFWLLSWLVKIRFFKLNKAVPNPGSTLFHPPVKVIMKSTIPYTCI